MFLIILSLGAQRTKANFGLVITDDSLLFLYHATCNEGITNPWWTCIFHIPSVLSVCHCFCFYFCCNQTPNNEKREQEYLQIFCADLESTFIENR